MEEWEINTLVNYIPFTDRNSWEQTRTQMYITAQVNSTKKLKPKELLEFAWEQKTPIKRIAPTQTEINKKRKEAMEIANFINSGGFSITESVSFNNINNEIIIN